MEDQKITVESSMDTKMTEELLGRKHFQSVKARTDKRRSISEKLADWMTLRFGSILFLAMNALIFTAWIVVNSGIIPFIQPFDPFPFGFLTMIVSLEAIFLAIIVLISQNRASKIADLREEIDLKLDTITEKELTKLLQLTIKQMQKEGFVLSKDKQLNDMIQPTNINTIERVLEKEIV